MTPIEIVITYPLPQNLIERIQAISPRLKITVYPARDAEAISSDRWSQTEILYTDGLLPDISKTPRLRWVQSHTTDFEFTKQSLLVQKEGLVFTNMSGVNANAVAEYVVMVMLALGHHFGQFISPEKFEQNSKEPLKTGQNIHGAVVGIVGYGSIGREIARLLQPFGVTILATKRDVMNPKDMGYYIQGFGDPEGDLFHRLYPSQAMRTMLKECNYILLTLPYTEGTHHLINDNIFDIIKPYSYLINISHPEIIDMAALTKAVTDKKIVGFASDTKDMDILVEDLNYGKLANLIMTLCASTGVSGDSNCLK